MKKKRKYKEPLSTYTFNILRQPPKENLEDDLRWICYALGLINPRDRDESCLKIVEIVLEASKEEEGISSNEITKRLNLTRGAVINHLNRLMQARFIIKRGTNYELRERNIKRTIEKIRGDIDRFLEELLQIAESVDKAYKLKARRH